MSINEQMPILRTNKLSTGIQELDIILEGGYQNPGNLMILGPSGIEKSAMGYHFASALKEDENAYIICGTSSPQDIINKASQIGIDLNAPSIYFIDCYSSTLGKEQQSTEKITIVPGPSALNDISLALNEAFKASEGKRMRVVFDTWSTFVIYNAKDSIRKFLSVIEGRLKNANATALFLVDEGVHENQLLSLIEHGMDSKYVLNDKGGKIELIVPGLDLELPVRAGPTGLSIV